VWQKKSDKGPTTLPPPSPILIFGVEASEKEHEILFEITKIYHENNLDFSLL